MASQQLPHRCEELGFVYLRYVWESLLEQGCYLVLQKKKAFSCFVLSKICHLKRESNSGCVTTGSYDLALAELSRENR
jgi:hypothetical protein